MMANVTLRALEPEDADLLFRWENDSDVWTDSGTLAPFSLQQITDYVLSYDADIFKSRQLRLMVVSHDGATVGTVDLYDFDPMNSRSFIGLYIAPEYRGKNYGVEAILEVSRFCKRRLFLNQLAAIVSVNNTASRNTVIAAGFTPSGRLSNWIRVSSGNFVDAEIFQKIL